jgi:hypothetical protein
VAPLVELGGVWSKALGFIYVFLVVAVKVFLHLIYSKEKYYKLRNFNVICIDSAGINCVNWTKLKLTSYWTVKRLIALSKQIYFC